MTTPTHTVCPACRNAIVVDYVRLGAVMECPHCRRPTVPEVTVGGAYPLSGYQLRFADFQRLIEEAEREPSISQLLADWFGVRVHGVGRDVSAVAGNGDPVDPLTLHLEIQSDPARQHALYQVAMSLWR